jgi:hypothetical protein
MANSLQNGCVIDVMTTLSSFSFIIHDRYFVFMTATAGNPVAHKCVITKGSKAFIALCDEVSLFHKQPKLKQFTCIKDVFQGTITEHVYELFLFPSRQFGDIASSKWASNTLTISHIETLLK